jgi:DNA sulfur modification protein DndC
MFSTADELMPDVPAMERPMEVANLWEQVVRSVRNEYLSRAQDYPWIIGFSGGKDSTVVAQAVFEALLQVSPSQRTRHVHVVSNDTQVESPLVMAHLTKVQSALREMTQTSGGRGNNETSTGQNILDAADWQRLSKPQPDDALVHRPAQNSAD